MAPNAGIVIQTPLSAFLKINAELGPVVNLDIMKSAKISNNVKIKIAF